MTKNSFKSRIMEKTAGMRSISDVKSAEIEDTAPRVPRTGPGALAALGVAQLRIEALEKRLVAEGGGKIAVDAIDPNPWQPRRVFSAQEMDELVGAIRESGLIQPIVVRAHPREPGRYQLVAGERRLRAHKILEWDTIVARVIELDDVDMAQNSLMENISRANLSDYEICLALDRMAQEFPSRHAVAQALGYSRSQGYRLMSFLKLPPTIRADLDERPRLLGAAAASELVGVLAAVQEEQVGQAQDQLGRLWALLKQGEVEQGKLASLLAARLAQRKTVSRVRYVRTFFAGGRQVGGMYRDGRDHLILRLKEPLITDEQQKEIDEFFARLFPQT